MSGDKRQTFYSVKANIKLKKKRLLYMFSLKNIIFYIFLIALMWKGVQVRVKM